MRTRPLAAVLSVLCACSSSPAPSPGDAATADTPRVDAAQDAPATAGTTVRFALPARGLPQPGEVPFPSDLYLRGDPDGTLTDLLDDWSLLGVGSSASGQGSLNDGYGAIDGFARNTGGLFVIDGMGHPAPAILPATAGTRDPDAAYAIIDIDAMSPARLTWVPTAAGYVERFRTLNVQPDGVVLEPGRRYAAVVTTRLSTSAGPLGAPPEFARIRDLAATARTTPAEQLYGAAADAVVEAGIARERIAGLAVFTTQSAHRQLRATRDALVAGTYGPAPQLNTDTAMAMPYRTARFGAGDNMGWTATLTAWLGTPARDAMGRDLPGEPHGSEPPTTGVPHDALGAVITGTFVSPEFRRPWTGSTARTDGTISTDAMGAFVVVNRDKTLPITLALPRTAPPAEGWPVVIFGHGLGGQRKQLLGVANELARSGIATVGIDTASFGQRATNAATDATSLFGTRGTYRGPDGLPDEEFYDNTDFFGGLSNILALRDNIRQTALDYVQVRRLLGNPALDLSFAAAQYPGATLRFNPARVGYIGNSLGGIVGTVFAAVEPTVNPFVLNVPGGGLITALATDSPSIGSSLNTASTIIFGYPSAAAVNRYHPLPALLQGVLDGGDPTAFASEVTRPATGMGHDVWMTMAHGDSVVPNRANELLARAMRLPQVAGAFRTVPGLETTMSPVRGNVMGRTQALLLQAPATHGGNLSQRYGTLTFRTPFPRDDQPPAMRFTSGAAVRIRNPAVIYQRAIAAFYTSTWMGAGVIDAANMTAYEDFDDDLWTDAEERAMSTDPFDPMSRPAGTAPRTRDVGF
jgi:dienelactone hydrolase